MDHLEKVLANSRTSKRHYAMVVIVVVVFAGLFYAGYRPWKARQNRLFASTAPSRELLVSTVKATLASPTIELTFSGAVSSNTETPIYARAEGYVRARKADIGDKVKAGQVLAEIDTPELDELLRQSQYRYNQFKASSGSTMANFRLAQANMKLAEIVLGRTEKLVKEGVLSNADLDDKQAQRDVRSAELASAQAAVESAEEGKKAVNSEIERFRALSVFKKIVAPFDGVITARTCEVGNLITTASLASGREMFRLADPNDLRFVVNVPQPSAPSVRVGTSANLSLPESPGKVWPGKVVRTAQALDPVGRTLMTEIKLDNRQGGLMPGLFGEVKMRVDRPVPPVMIPGDTPVVRSDGTYVAIVTPENTIHFQKLVVGRDLGSMMEIYGGLSGGERLVVNPSDEVREGVHVRTSEEKPPPK